MLFFVLPHAPIDPPHIVRCGDVLSALAREAGTSVQTPRFLAEHRIYVDRRDVAPLETMRTIALAVGASLVRTKDGYRVERTSQDLKEIRQRRQALRESWIQKRIGAVEGFRKANSGKDALIDALARDAEARQAVEKGVRKTYPTMGPRQLLPSAVLLEGLLGRIGISALAAIPSGQNRVYEDFPVPSSFSLPKHDDLLAKYRASIARLNGTNLGDQVGPTDRAGIVKGLPDSPEAIVRLRLACESSANALGIRLEAFDRLGHRLDRAGLFVGAEEDLVRPEVFTEEAAKRETAKWITFSPEAKRTLEEATSSSDGTFPNWFANPVQREPLDLFVREAIAGICVAQKGCLAYDVSDYYWAFVRDCVSGGRMSVDAILRTLDTYLPTERLVLDGATVWRLIDPEADEPSRADRSVLRTFARNCAVGRAPSFRARCHLYHDASHGPNSIASIWDSIASARAPMPESSLPAQAYAFLGSIGDAQWDRLVAGGRITAAQLGATDDLLHLFARGYGYDVSGEKPVPDLFSHALELYGSTELGATPIIVRTSRNPVVRYWSNDGHESPLWSPLNILKQTFAISPDAFRVVDGRLTTSYTKTKYEARYSHLLFRNGVRDDLRINLRLPGGFFTAWDVLTTVASDPKPFAYADLSEAVRASNWETASQDALEAARSNRGRAPKALPRS